MQKTQNHTKSQHENGRTQAMAGRCGSILLIVILVFAALFLMLYMQLRAFELNIHSSKTERRSSHKNIMKTDIQRRVGNVLSVLLYLKDSRDPDVRGYLFP
jgi:cell division protein FtsL